MLKPRARTEFESARDSLIKYCELATHYSCEVKETSYPMKVVFTPVPRLPGFTDESRDVGALTIEVGLDTRVISTLEFEMDSNLLKKFIKSSEKLAFLYYHAFREEAGDLRLGYDQIMDQLKQAIEK